jgi:hypothetical protein
LATLDVCPWRGIIALRGSTRIPLFADYLQRVPAAGRSQEEDIMAKQDPEVLAEIDGSAASVLWGGRVLVPFGWGLFGSTRLELLPTRVVEDTKYFVSSKQNEIPLTEIDSVEFTTRGNQLMLWIGIPLIGACGIGLLVCLLYFVFRCRFLIIRSRATTQVIGVKGHPDPYLDFMQDVLAEAERIKGSRADPAATAPSAPAPSHHHAPSSPRSSAVEPSRSEKKAAASGIIACPNCGAEYRLPPGSGGKKFRCQNCKGVIEAPDDGDYR